MLSTDPFNFIKFKNEILHKYFFKILPRFLKAAFKGDVSVKGVHGIPKLEYSHLESRQNL